MTRPVTHIGRAANQTRKFTHAGHQGVYAAIHSAAPPPAEKYEAWLDLQLAKTRGRQCKLTGAKLRRAVVMRRNGCGYAEIATAIGVSTPVAHRWLNDLPEGLAA